MVKFCPSCGDIVRGQACSKCGPDTQAAPPTQDLGSEQNVAGGSLASKYGNQYLSSGLSQGIDTGLRQMLGMKESGREESCADCSSKLKGNGDIFVGQDDGKAYCQGCYAKRFKVGQCDRCSQPVLGLGRPYVKEKGKLYHRECFVGQACSGCLEPIVGEAIQALGNNFHPACFTCRTCSVRLTDNFVDTGGLPSCKACAPFTRKMGNKQARSVGSGTSSPVAPRSPTSPRPGSGGVGGGNGEGGSTGAPKAGYADSPNLQRPEYRTVGDASSDKSKNSMGGREEGCVSDAERRKLNNEAAGKRQQELEELRQGVRLVNVKDRCASCNEEMYSNGVQAGGLIYHTECFLCKHCGKDFPEGRFVAKEEGVYHSECYKKVGGSVGGEGGKCPICSKALSGKFLQWNDDRIHPECFKCEKCSASLQGKEFGQEGDKAYCSKCIVSIINPGPTSIGGLSRGGMTVNPITGTQEARTYGGARVQGAVRMAPDQSTRCMRCQKTVYPAEKVSGPEGHPWHRGCLRCADCGRQLELGKVAAHGTEAYCSNCHGKQFGPKGVGFGQGAGTLNMGQ
eukprot:comp12034_c0_seq1/m.6730 comp12034_c0_seq1/g.6730  ORF comp12034_c0_seq1/g.6730 comp12034_c0_seq1/m.6730 type:complete len:567 (-) comp12034_c0_seq1:70-1770(-)